MSTTPIKAALHFSTNSYPIFGRGTYSDQRPPKTVSSSPYFWWFKFLQLNADYLNCHKAEGEGLMSKLYADFGDIWATDFKSWWNTHSRLFAEPRSDYSMLVANSAAELAPFNSLQAINLVVPLNWTRKGLKKRFAQIVDQRVAAGQRGPALSISQAEYQIGTRWNIGAFEAAYSVYKIRQANMERGAANSTRSQHKGAESKKFRIAWADIAIRAKLGAAEGVVEGRIKSDTADQRRTLTILANRHYLRAQEFIAAAATRQFPSPSQK
jgi:hypothetical protein